MEYENASPLKVLVTPPIFYGDSIATCFGIDIPGLVFEVRLSALHPPLAPFSPSKTITRRFLEFQKLHDKLSQTFQTKTRLPVFPSINRTSRLMTVHLEELYQSLSESLTTYLTHHLSIPAVFQSLPFIEFFDQEDTRGPSISAIDFVLPVGRANDWSIVKIGRRGQYVKKIQVNHSGNEILWKFSPCGNSITFSVVFYCFSPLESTMEGNSSSSLEPIVIHHPTSYNDRDLGDTGIVRGRYTSPSKGHCVLKWENRAPKMKTIQYLAECVEESIMKAGLVAADDAAERREESILRGQNGWMQAVVTASITLGHAQSIQDDPSLKITVDKAIQQEECEEEKSKKDNLEDHQLKWQQQQEMESKEIPVDNNENSLLPEIHHERENTKLDSENNVVVNDDADPSEAKQSRVSRFSSYTLSKSGLGSVKKIDLTSKLHAQMDEMAADMAILEDKLSAMKAAKDKLSAKLSVVSLENEELKGQLSVAQPRNQFLEEQTIAMKEMKEKSDKELLVLRYERDLLLAEKNAWKHNQEDLERQLEWHTVRMNSENERLHEMEQKLQSMKQRESQSCQEMVQLKREKKILIHEYKAQQKRSKEEFQTLFYGTHEAKMVQKSMALDIKRLKNHQEVLLEEIERLYTVLDETNLPFVRVFEKNQKDSSNAKETTTETNMEQHLMEDDPDEEETWKNKHIDETNQEIRKDETISVQVVPGALGLLLNPNVLYQAVVQGYRTPTTINSEKIRQAGVQPGSVIVAIDDLDTTLVSLNQVKQLLRESSNTSRTITFRLEQK